MERQFNRSLDFNALLVSTRAPCTLTLSVTPEYAGLRTSTLQRSTATLICFRSSTRFPLTSTCIGHRQGYGGDRAAWNKTGEHSRRKSRGGVKKKEAPQPS